MSTFFYLGPIRTNQRAQYVRMSLKETFFNVQKLSQMTFLGLFRCKQTFSETQNVAKFRLIQPSTYELWHICPLFSISAQYVRIGQIRTNESKRTFNVQKLPKMTFLGLFRCKQTFFTKKVDQVIQDSNEIFLMYKNYVFRKMTPGYPT